MRSFVKKSVEVVGDSTKIRPKRQIVKKFSTKPFTFQQGKSVECFS